MADRRPRNSNAATYRSKQTKRETVTAVYMSYQTSTSTSRRVNAPAPSRNKAPAQKKTVSRVTKPQQRKPTVKQLENKLNSQAKKVNQLQKQMKQLNEAKKLKQPKKKQAPVPNKERPIVNRKVIIQEGFYY